MTVDTDDQLEGLRRVGVVAATALTEVCAAAGVGVTTRDLDDIGSSIFRMYGARSEPRVFKSFPGTLCISVNEEAVHGVPALRPIMPGDVIKIDVTPILDGFVADTARTIVIGDDATSHRLVASAERALDAGIAAARPRRRTRDIGRAIDRIARQSGFKVLREVGGHGLGHGMHEAPHVPNWDDPRGRDVLHEGLVLAVEPIISVSDEWLTEGDDGWLLKTIGGSFAAHVEHTIVVGDGDPIVLTAA
ncbi:MAG: type I methionyl aminopeptidase [Vicinamibacterales bacterium]